MYNFISLLVVFFLIIPQGYAAKKQIFLGDGIVPPKKTTTQRDALSASSGQIIYNTTQNKLNVHNGTTWGDLGGSSTGINYVPTGDAESGTSAFMTYADAAGTSPVDCTGGSPNSTWTASSSSPLRGTYNFLFTKGAANRQGEGVATTVTIDAADKAKVLTISFDYEVGSGTFQSGSDSQDSDLTVWMYDVTNAQVIQPASYKLTGASTGQFKYQGTFQSASNSTSYRLCLHQSVTGTSAYTLKVDSVKVGPEPRMYGVPSTDWISYSPIVSNIGSGSMTTNAYWRRVGDSMEININSVKSGGAGSGASVVTYSLPSGITSDTSKLPAGSTAGIPLGRAATYDISGAGYEETGIALYSNTIALLDLGTGSYLTGSTLGANSGIAMNVKFPVQGWSSTVSMSNDSDTRVVVARASGAAASTTSGNIIVFPTNDFDTHAAYSTSTGRFTAPVSGYYRVCLNANSTNTFAASVYKNAASDTLVAVVVSGAGGGCAPVRANAGDLLDIRPNATTGVWSASSAASFERLTGPSAIAASETVAMSVYGNPGAGSPSTGAASTVIMGTEAIDTHGAYNTTTGEFTCPVSGFYSSQIAAEISGTEAADNSNYVALFKNGTVIENTVGGARVQAGSLSTTTVRGGGVFKCIAGDVITMRFSTSVTAPAWANTLQGQVMSINKIGGLP